MADGEALLAGRLTRRTMTWLIVAVLAAAPIEALSTDHRLVLATMPVRTALLVVNLWLLRSRRLTPVGSGRLFLAQAVFTTFCWGLLLGSGPAQLAFESTGYGTILSIFALVMAPRDSRRWWSLGVIGVVLVPAAAGLLPAHALLFAQLVTILAVHGLALATLDVHAKQAETESRMASLDPLTGLWNRRPTLVQLAEQVARTGGAPASVLMLDLDHFKDLNDTLGHEAGDDALRDVADALTALVRRHDVLSRWGGEEFLVLLPGADGHDAVATAERFRAGVARTGTTASIGVAELRPDDTVAAWVARADAAMYAAKQRGRNRVALAPGAEGAPDAPPPEVAPRAEGITGAAVLDTILPGGVTPAAT